MLPPLPLTAFFPLRVPPKPNPTASPPHYPQPAVGSHRMCAAEAVALLLGPNNNSLGKAVASAKLVPAIMHLALSHPLCSRCIAFVFLLEGRAFEIKV